MMMITVVSVNVMMTVEDMTMIATVGAMMVATVDVMMMAASVMMMAASVMMMRAEGIEMAVIAMIIAIEETKMTMIEGSIIEIMREVVSDPTTVVMIVTGRVLVILPVIMGVIMIGTMIGVVIDVIGIMVTHLEVSTIN